MNVPYTQQVNGDNDVFVTDPPYYYNETSLSLMQ